MHIKEKRSLSDYLFHINEEEEIIGPKSNLLENSSSPIKKEESQRGDLKFGMSEESQSNNCLNNNEDLINNDSVIEEKKKQKNLYYLLYDKNYIIYEEITVILIINNKENKIKFENVQYDEIKITYEKFIKLSKEEIKNQFKLKRYNFLFENKDKLIGNLNEIKEIANINFSKIILENELSIKINLKEVGNIFFDENIIKINSEYVYIDKSNQIKNQDKNILNGSNYEGFKSFSKKIIGYISNQTNINNNSTKDASNNSKQINKSNFIIFKKVIGEHKKIAKKIRELDDGSFVSVGDDEIIKYNKNFSKFRKYDSNQIGEKYYTFFINNKNEVIISLKNGFTSLSKLGTRISDIKGIYPCRNLFESKIDNYIICSDNGIYYASNIFNPISKDENFLSKKYDKAYRGGIKITDYIIAITSNRKIPNGENKLVFFSSKSQKLLKDFEIENYSFTISENNCSIMKIPNYENKKLLLVACKKYFKDDKNGILLINLQFNNDDIEKKCQKFYDTKNFEVYCFCPLLKIDKKEVLNPAQKIDTGYFLVGGFDLDKEQGLIKLYKVIYYDEIEKIEIKSIQDIILKKKIGISDLEIFEGFKKPISCIIQSPQGEILATCHDGNVYLFSGLNFEKKRENENIIES